MKAKHPKKRLSEKSKKKQDLKSQSRKRLAKVNMLHLIRRKEKSEKLLHFSLPNLTMFQSLWKTIPVDLMM